jgi:hypothetical protein
MRLKKPQIVKLIGKHTYTEIAEMYGVSYAAVTKVMTIKFSEYVLPENLKKGRLPIKNKFYKVPYSTDEDDYGYFNDRKTMITKDGLLSFDGNSPLEEPEKSRLSTVAQLYKSTIK